MTLNNLHRYDIGPAGTVMDLKRSSILYGRVHPGGYVVVDLKTDLGVWKTFVLHVLVARACLENPDNKSHVRHKDGNKLNNHVSNLEWV